MQFLNSKKIHEQTEVCDTQKCELTNKSLFQDWEVQGIFHAKNDVSEDESSKTENVPAIIPLSNAS